MVLASDVFNLPQPKIQKLIPSLRTEAERFSRRSARTITLTSRRRRGFSTIAEQLERRRTFPFPLRQISDPRLTGVLASTLSLLTGAGAVRSIIRGLAIPTGAGFIRAVPEAETVIRERLLQPEQQTFQVITSIRKGISSIGENISKGLQSLSNLLTSPFKVPDINLPNIVIPSIAGAGILGGLALSQIISALRDTDIAELPQVNVTPPSISGGTPALVEPGKIEDKKEDKEKPLKPQNIKQSVTVNVNQKQTRKFINPINISI